MILWLVLCFEQHEITVHISYTNMKSISQAFSDFLRKRKKRLLKGGFNGDRKCMN